jgi:hypothetical protein
MIPTLYAPHELQYHEPIMTVYSHPMTYIRSQARNIYLFIATLSYFIGTYSPFRLLIYHWYKVEYWFPRFYNIYCTVRYYCIGNAGRRHEIS